MKSLDKTTIPSSSSKLEQAQTGGWGRGEHGSGMGEGGVNNADAGVMASLGKTDKERHARLAMIRKTDAYKMAKAEAKRARQKRRQYHGVPKLTFEQVKFGGHTKQPSTCKQTTRTIVEEKVNPSIPMEFAGCYALARNSADYQDKEFSKVRNPSPSQVVTSTLCSPSYLGQSGVAHQGRVAYVNKKYESKEEALVARQYNPKSEPSPEEALQQSVSAAKFVEMMNLSANW